MPALLVITVFIFLFAIPAVFLVKIWGDVYPFLFWGGINVPTTGEKIKKMVEMLQVKSGQKVVDLGAGEGRLLIALAKAGAKAYGYEINPLLVAKAQKNIQREDLEGKAFIYLKNMWDVDINGFDAVLVFPMKHIMKKLEKKFEKELKPGTKIVSNFFPLPTWKPDRAEENVYLYIKK